MNQVYIWAVAGGVLIGLASALPLWWHGRVAGASGVLSDILSKTSGDKRASTLYILGLILGSIFLWIVNKETLQSLPVPVDGRLVAGALLVGFGARLGSGCTSGHGVCGMARLSRRSIAATVIFLSVAALTATLLRTAL